jgi:hypothetical protein
MKPNSVARCVHDVPAHLSTMYPVFTPKRGENGREAAKRWVVKKATVFFELL